MGVFSTNQAFEVFPSRVLQLLPFDPSRSTKQPLLMRDDARDLAAHEDRPVLDDMRLGVLFHSTPRRPYTLEGRILRQSDDDSSIRRRGDAPCRRSIWVQVHHYLIRCPCLLTKLQELEDTTRVIAVPVAQHNSVNLLYGDLECSGVSLDGT